VTNETKLCGGCTCTLPLTDFPPRKRTAKAGGFRPRRASRCYECTNKATAAWRARNPDKQAAATRAWRQQFKEQHGISPSTAGRLRQLLQETPCTNAEPTGGE